MDEPLGCMRIYKDRNVEIIKCGDTLFAVGKGGRTKIGAIEREKNNKIISNNMY